MQYEALVKDTRAAEKQEQEKQDDQKQESSTKPGDCDQLAARSVSREEARRGREEVRRERARKRWATLLHILLLLLLVQVPGSS